MCQIDSNIVTPVLATTYTDINHLPIKTTWSRPSLCLSPLSHSQKGFVKQALVHYPRISPHTHTHNLLFYLSYHAQSWNKIQIYEIFYQRKYKVMNVQIHSLLELLNTLLVYLPYFRQTKFAIFLIKKKILLECASDSYVLWH